MAPCPDALRRPLVRLPALLLPLALLAGACRDRPAGGAGEGSASSLRHYTVRGELVSLPEPGGTGQLSLRHEAIDEFADASGKVVGMGSMVMPFDVAAGLALGELRPGDKVEARIAVGWSPALLQVVELRKLPADTVLEYRAARPTGAPK